MNAEAPTLRIGVASGHVDGFAEFEDLLDWATLHGIESIELSVTDAPVELPRSFTLPIDTIDTQVPLLLEQLSSRGLALCSLAPMRNPLAADEVRANSARRLIERCIDVAPALNAPIVKTFAGSGAGLLVYGLPGVPDGHPDSPLAGLLDRFEGVFGALATRAQALGVRLALETAPRGGGEGNLAHAPRLWNELFARVPSSALGLAFDPSHLDWVSGADIRAVASEAADRIHLVDAKDIRVFPEVRAHEGIYGNNWWRYRVPGEGEIDWTAFLAALLDAGYRGDLVIEMEDERYGGRQGVEIGALHLVEARRRAVAGG